MQANHSICTGNRIETYKCAPDAFPPLTSEAGADLARDWQAAHQAALAHDAMLQIKRMH